MSGPDFFSSNSSGASSAGDTSGGPASAKIISSNGPLKKRDKKKRSGSSASNTDLSGEGATVPAIDSYHRGGKVRKTGLARLKKGERVLTKGQQKRMVKRRGGRGKSR